METEKPTNRKLVPIFHSVFDFLIRGERDQMEKVIEKNNITKDDFISYLDLKIKDPGYTVMWDNLIRNVEDFKYLLKTLDMYGSEKLPIVLRNRTFIKIATDDTDDLKETAAMLCMNDRGVRKIARHVLSICAYKGRIERLKECARAFNIQEVDKHFLYTLVKDVAHEYKDSLDLVNLEDVYPIIEKLGELN